MKSHHMLWILDEYTSESESEYMLELVTPIFEHPRVYHVFTLPNAYVTFGYVVTYHDCDQRCVRCPFSTRRPFYYSDLV